MDVEIFTKYVPHAVALGLETVSVEMGAGRCVMRLPWRADLVGDPERNIIHGGAITTLLDTLGGCCVFAAGEGMWPQATLDLRIDYLRPARPHLDLLGDATCFRTTRHVAFVRGLCHQGNAEEPIAQMTAAFMLADRPNLVAGPRS